MTNLPQYGGEGKAAYKGKKSDMSLPQYGGEGRNLKKKGFGGLLKPDSKYRGPGADLKRSS